MTLYRLVTRTTSVDGMEIHERVEPVTEWQAAQELAAEQFIHDLDGWTTRAGIGRVHCWKGTVERIIEAKEHRA